MFNLNKISNHLMKCIKKNYVTDSQFLKKLDLILLDLDGKPNGMKPITGMNGILSGLLYFLNGRLL